MTAHTESIWRDVRHVASTGSTNADVAALARTGAEEGLVLVADEQTAGRGRLARTWASPAGVSVAVSVLLQPTQSFERWGWLSLVAGVAVAGALEELAPEQGIVELKWPNDVLVRGRKVCGILSERVDPPGSGRGPYAVVGMGINLAVAEDQLPVPTATSLLLEGFRVDRDDAVATVLEHFEEHYRTWQTTGTVRDVYESRCASIGTRLEIVVDAQHSARGIGHGVDDLGRLQVETGSGVETFAVGDVVHARLQP